MELWIRSQDKEKLVKCNDIAIMTDSEDGKNIRGYKIVGYFDKNTEYEELGFYTSKKRALEVLDKIQKIFVFDTEFQGSYQWIDMQIKGLIAKSMIGYVYQMPKN